MVHRAGLQIDVGNYGVGTNKYSKWQSASVVISNHMYFYEINNRTTINKNVFN